MEERKRGSCNGFQSLTLEIISEILARLPIESIITYKGVCKTWYSLINESYFVKLQLSRAKDRPSSRLIFEPRDSHSITIRYWHRLRKLYLFDIQDYRVRMIPEYPVTNIKYDINGMNIMCSLDGLICLASAYDINPVVIYNPLIRGDYVILPKTEARYSYIDAHHITLGFDHSINKYKAVRMLNYQLNLLHYSLFEVITVGEESSWRRMVAPYAGLIHKSYGGCGGIFHQGSIYWIIDKFYDYANGETSNNRELILEFDVTNEVFRVVSFPHSMRAPEYIQHNYINRFNMKLQILGGSLALMQLEGRLLHIWRLMKENGTHEVVGYKSIKIESPYKYATISAFLCLNGDDDFLLLRSDGGFEPNRNRKGERIKTKGPQFYYYYPYSKKNDRFVYLSSSLQNIPYQDRYSYTWCFKPSLISIKAASGSHL